MDDNVEINLPPIPSGIGQIVFREEALVSLNSASADVRVETVWSLSLIPPPPPQVTSSCDNARTWTFSGSHMTNTKGVMQIHLNKFLECIPRAIEGAVYSNYIGSRPDFTATPESEGPAFLTCSIDAATLQPPQGQVFLPQALDVKITVRSWKHDGQPAANVAFNWIAIARAAVVTNF